MLSLLNSATDKVVNFISIPESLLYALIGFIVTFLGIAILIFFVWIMGKIMDAVNKRVKNVKKSDSAVSETSTEPIEQGGIPEEVVVAITAAISMYYEGEKSSCEFKVKRIKRL